MKLGEFEYRDDKVIGPSRYMEERGNTKVDLIATGEDETFKRNAEFCPDMVTCLLVTLQTDYAGWRGEQQMLNWLGQEF